MPWIPMGNIKVVLCITFIFLAKMGDCQTKKIFYNFPDNVEVHVNKRLISTIDQSQIHDNKVFMVVNRNADTTQILIASLLSNISTFGFILENTNRYFRTKIGSNQSDIPIVFSSDFFWSESAFKKGYENGRKANTRINVLLSGYSIEFVFKKNEALIVEDKYVTD
jgi:hypothetical protein